MKEFLYSVLRGGEFTPDLCYRGKVPPTFSPLRTVYGPLGVTIWGVQRSWDLYYTTHTVKRH